MQRVFLTVADMSIVASLVIAAVLPVRLALRRAPKRFSCMLWAVVLFRLLCPFAAESPFGLIPERAGAVARSAALPGSEHVTFVSAASAAYRAAGDAANGGLDLIPVEAGAPAQPGAQPQYLSATQRQVWLLLCARLWPVGAAAVVIWGVRGQFCLRRRLVGAVRAHGNVWLADRIPTAFVTGLLRPRIYLPSGLAGPGLDFVLEHERAHIRRGDHVFRLLAFAALALHWFNPLVWLAFGLSGRDMEMSCDEEVLRRSDADIRAGYCQTLLDMSANRPFPGPCPLAFGESDAGARVKNALRWKRPAPWAVTGAAALTLLVCVIVLTNQMSGKGKTVELTFSGKYSEYADDCDAGPFTMSIRPPEGWTVTPADTGAPDTASAYPLLPDTYNLQPIAYMYGEDGGYAGFIAWGRLTRPNESNHYVWQDFAQVVSGETEVYTAAVIYDVFDESLLPEHPWTSFETNGIRMENAELDVYVCVQFAPGAVDGDALALAAGSLELSGEQGISVKFRYPKTENCTYNVYFLSFPTLLTIG